MGHLAPSQKSTQALPGDELAQDQITRQGFYV